MAGWAYNQKDPNAPNAGPRISLVGGIFTSVALLCVVLRVYVRSLLIRSFGADDYTISATWLLSLGFTVVSVIQTKWGMGLHIEDFPPENAVPFAKLQYAGVPFYILGILGFKLSLLISYLRIASDRTYKRIVMGLIVACTSFSLAFLFTQLFMCNPPSFQWDCISQNGTCLDGPTVYYATASLTMVFDVIVITTPIPLLINSQLPVRKKVLLVGLFGLGFFITICQLIRILTVKGLKNYIDSSMLIMWSMAELNLGVITVCIPTLTPLVQYFRGQSTNPSSKKFSNDNTYSNPRARAGYMKGGGVRRSVHSMTDPERAFALDHTGDTTRTVINGGSTRGDPRGMKDSDSEEYIMAKGDTLSAGSGKEALGGIRADTEVTVEISRSEVKPRSVY